MESQIIINLLLSNEKVKQQFRGVLASDELTFMHVKRPALFVVNTDTSENAGLHWVCIYFPKSPEDGIEFFDSLAYPPNVYNNFISTFLTANGANFIYSKKRIQNYFTSSCGLFCILFSVLRCEGKSFCDILNLLTNNLRFNEEIISHYITNLGCLSI